MHLADDPVVSPEIKTANYGVLGKRLPVRIQTDNGSEFISKSLDKWPYEHRVTMDFSRPGKPTDNPVIEFNGSLRVNA
jgi:putative transposase